MRAGVFLLRSEPRRISHAIYVVGSPADFGRWAVRIEAAGRRPAPSHVSQRWGGPRVAHIRIREPVPRVDPTRDEFEGLYFRARRGLVRIARTGTYAAFHIRRAGSSGRRCLVQQFRIPGW